LHRIQVQFPAATWEVLFWPPWVPGMLLMYMSTRMHMHTHPHSHTSTLTHIKQSKKQKEKGGRNRKKKEGREKEKAYEAICQLPWLLINKALPTKAASGYRQNGGMCTSASEPRLWS